MRTIFQFTIILLLNCPWVQAQKGEWISLFDGETLEGWSIQSGTARYHVEDGVIVGTAVPNSPNTFLCSDRSFADFILEFEVYLVDPQLNSGVQFRSHIAEEAMVFWFRDNEGVPRQQHLPEGRVYGYQVEIAEAAGGGSGGVYDEARRAFMIYRSEPGSAASKAFKNDQWNKYRIECRGNSIKTFVNDVPCADFLDNMTKSGLIGLQVHGVGEETTPYQVKWRNIRLMEL